MNGNRSAARPQAEAPGRRALLPARRLPRRGADPGPADGDDRQGPGRPDPGPAGRRPAPARREGLRVRAGPAVRPLPAHRLPPPQGPARSGDRRLRAGGAVGLLLRVARRTGGAVRMAELETTDIRETVRDRYAAAARAATGCGCGPGESFGATLYDAASVEGVPDAAVDASLGCGVPTAVADLHPG